MGKPRTFMFLFGDDIGHRYLIEVDCSLGLFMSAKLKDKEDTINVTSFSLFGNNNYKG